MIHSVFELGDTIVREVMVPRTDMVFIERDKTLRQACRWRCAAASAGSRSSARARTTSSASPTSRTSSGGCTTTTRPRPTERVGSVMRQPVFVPDTKPVDELLREMQHQRDAHGDRRRRVRRHGRAGHDRGHARGDRRRDHRRVRHGARRRRAARDGALPGNARLPVDDLASCSASRSRTRTSRPSAGCWPSARPGADRRLGGRRRRAASSPPSGRRPAQPDRDGAGQPGPSRPRPTSEAAHRWRPPRVAEEARASTSGVRARRATLDPRRAHKARDARCAPTDPEDARSSPWPAPPGPGPARPRAPRYGTPTAGPTPPPPSTLPRLRAVRAARSRSRWRSRPGRRGLEAAALVADADAVGRRDLAVLGDLPGPASLVARRPRRRRASCRVTASSRPEPASGDRAAGLSIPLRVRLLRRPAQRRQVDADQRAGRRQGRHHLVQAADHPARHPRHRAPARRAAGPRRHPRPAPAADAARRAAQRPGPRPPGPRST